jgi:hypothetical protein
VREKRADLKSVIHILSRAGSHRASLVLLRRPPPRVLPLAQDRDDSHRAVRLRPGDDLLAVPAPVDVGCDLAELVRVRLLPGAPRSKLLVRRWKYREERHDEQRTGGT